MSKQSITLKNAVESAFFRMRLCHNQMSRGELLRLKTRKSLPDPGKAGLSAQGAGHMAALGRMYLRARDYFADFEKVYGAHGVLPYSSNNFF